MSLKQTRRQLTHSEVFRLTTWYQENKAALLQMTDTGICQKAAEALKIEGLNDGHMVRVRETLGIKKRESRSGEKQDGSADLEALICLQNEQGDKIASLQSLAQGLLDRVRKLESAHR